MTQLMWSAAALLGFVKLINRGEIPNLITKGSVDLFPLGSYPSKLLDCFWNETKYVHCLDQIWRQQIT